MKFLLSFLVLTNTLYISHSKKYLKDPLLAQKQKTLDPFLYESAVVRPFSIEEEFLRPFEIDKPKNLIKTYFNRIKR